MDKPVIASQLQESHRLGHVYPQIGPDFICVLYRSTHGHLGLTEHAHNDSFERESRRIYLREPIFDPRQTHPADAAARYSRPKQPSQTAAQYTRWDSNPKPLASEASALSN
jgi:hypothetical protein